MQPGNKKELPYFASIPIKLEEDLKICAGAVRFALHCHSLKGEKDFWTNSSLVRNVSRKKAAKILGVTKKTISNYLYELEKRGWITVKNPRRKEITIYLHRERKRRKKRKKRT